MERETGGGWGLTVKDIEYWVKDFGFNLARKPLVFE